MAYVLPENASGTPNVGEYLGGRLGYSADPFNVAVSYATAQGANGTVVNSKYEEISLAGSYKATSGVNLMAHAGINNSDVVGTRHAHWGLGASIAIGSGYIPIGYNSVRQNNSANWGADQIALGYVYNFSGRTAIYTTVSHISNRNGANYTFLGGNNGGNPQLVAGGSDGTAFDLGVRHAF